MGLIFDGVDLEERFGLMVDGAATWPKPARDRTLVHVPGRNGDLIFDNGCWQNVEVAYNFLIKDGFKDRFEEFARWICAKRGYFMLEDPERHPDVYRMAEFADSIDPKLWFTTRTGIFTLKFNCKPQQFLYIGDAPLYRLLPNISGYELRSPYMPISGKTVKYTPTIDASATGTITGTVIAYDSNKTQVQTSGAVTLTNGTAVTFTITDNSAAYWRLVINVNNANNIDLISARVVATVEIDGAAFALDAIFARSYFYKNPTGYATKPKITYLGKEYQAMFALYEDGIRNYYYTLRVNDYSSLSDRSIMDCSMQSIYYEYQDPNTGMIKKANLGSYLLMTDAESAVGQAMSFPEMSEDTTLVYLYTGGSNDIGLIKIEPRWWRV